MRTTIPDPSAQRASDLVDRQFGVDAPNQRLVADFTYVRLVTGVFVYVAFVIDAYAGTIIGWETATSKHTRFVESAIRQAVALRARQGHPIHDAVHRSEEGWLSAIDRGSLDPHRGYYNALVNGLDCPTVVIEAFQVIQRANMVVDEVRRRVQQDLLGHRGRSGDPLYGIRRLLLAGAEGLSPTGRQRLGDGLSEGDPDAAVWHAHHCKELVRSVYRAEDATQAAEALYADASAVGDVPELIRLARTIRRRHNEVMAYCRTDRLTNAASESVNALIKRIKRIGHGFRNRHNYRLRLLLFCGGVNWQDQSTASIRSAAHHA